MLTLPKKNPHPTFGHPHPPGRGPSKQFPSPVSRRERKVGVRGAASRGAEARPPIAL